MNEVINYDVHRVDGVDKNTTRVRKLLESYARNISTMAANETIMADVRATDQTISPIERRDLCGRRWVLW